MPRKKIPEPVLVAVGERIGMPGQCPECNDSHMLQMAGYEFCPVEDVHPGGVIVRDGRVKRADRHLDTRRTTA